MTCSCHYPFSDLIYLSLYANISTFISVVCMLMSAPGIMTQEINQVRAMVGGEVGIFKKDKEKMKFNIFPIQAYLSLGCLLPAGKIPQGTL